MMSPPQLCQTQKGRQRPGKGILHQVAAQQDQLTIAGKTYTIERSVDMKSWARVPFAIEAPAASQVSYRATTVSVLSAYAAPAVGDVKEFYRLTVR